MFEGEVKDVTMFRGRMFEYTPSDIEMDLPGKSGEIFCRLVHLSHLGFECDGRFVAQS